MLGEELDKTVTRAHCFSLAFDLVLNDLGVEQFSELQGQETSQCWLSPPQKCLVSPGSLDLQAL